MTNSSVTFLKLPGIFFLPEYFFSFFIAVKYTLHRLYHFNHFFLLYNSMALNTFTVLSNYHLYLFPELCHHSKQILYPLHSNSPFPPLLNLSKPLFYFMGLPVPKYFLIEVQLIYSRVTTSCTTKWFRYIHIYNSFPDYFASHNRLLQDIKYISWCYTVNSCCSSILCVVVYLY